MAQNFTTGKGTWLVIGIVIGAGAFFLFSRFTRAPSPDVQDLLRQEGVPAARQGIALSQEGKKLLPLEEQRELDALYAEAFKSLTEQERQRFLSLAQKGTSATDREIAESAELVQKALRTLAPTQSTRLWALVEKSVQLAQQKETSAGDSKPVKPSE